MLGKRETITSLEKNIQPHNKPFLEKHLPELLEPSGRMKYFIDYEFPKKQTLLRDFWKRALQKFFKHGLKGGIVYWEDLKEFFHVDHSYPLGLPKVVAEFASQGTYLILSDLRDNKELLRIFKDKAAGPLPADGLWTRLKGLWGAAPVVIGDKSRIVDVDEFRQLFDKIEMELPGLFGESRVMMEEEFLRAYGAAFAVNKVDQEAVLYLLLQLGVLHKKRIENVTVYYLHTLAREPEMEVQAALEEVILEKKMLIFDNKLGEITNTISSMNRELLELKKQGRKVEAMALLQKRRVLSEQYEKLNGKRLLLQSLHDKLKTTHDERQLADILQKTNELLRDKDKQFDKLTDVLGDFQALSNQTEALTNLINDMQKGSELDELYENLGESMERERPSTKPVTTAQAVAVNHRRPSKSSLQTEPQPKGNLEMTESQIFQKRINELLE